MKHLKLFFALFAMLALGVTNAWGAEETYTLGWGSASGTNYQNFTAVSGEVLNVLSFNSEQNNAGSAPAYNANSKELRLYFNDGGNGGSITLNPVTGVTITGVTITASSTSYTPDVKYNVDGGDDLSGSWSSTTMTISGINAKSSLKFRNANTTNKQLRIKTIQVTYVKESTAETTIKTLKSIAVEGMTTDYETGDIFKFDGTCTATYGVTKNDVPQEDETKEVTPTSVSTPDMSTAGEKEVTVTYTEDEVTVTATYTINVTENEITAGEYELALNNTFFGTTAAANVSAFPTSAKQDDITVTLNGAGTKTRTDADCVRMYASNTLTFSVPAGYVITSITFAEPSSTKWDGSITVDAGTYTDNTKSWAGSAQEVVFSFGAQNRIATATVTYAEAGDTPEVPTLDAPTFSLAEDTYTEAQEVTLSAEEGTIYYTLDGTTPDAESIEYTTPIVLNECGEITIKAIAISGEITSSVASATYTIKLPLNNSQANPYTEADAIEVYDGGCYDNQDVYVKGVVANAQFYSSNTYTITLEGGFQFYKFYEAAGEVTFTEDYIVAGDTLVACGKLNNYKGTYRLAAGCYLVERKPYSVPKVDISNTPETAYTVAQAIALIDNVTSDLTKQVYVKGQISEVESYNESYGSITYWIVDEDKNKFQCYSGKGLNNEQFTSVEDLVIGSQVVVYGKMKKYNSTYEFDYNNYIVSLTLPSYTVTVTAENGTIEGLAVDGKYEHGDKATLTAIPAEGYEFVNWTVGEDVIAETAEYTFTVTADVALVANFVVDEPEPVAMTGVVKRALQMGESTVILTHEADGTAHIYNVVEGLAYEVSQEGVVPVDPENKGSYLAISDIAVTEDGKLVANNYVRCQFGTATTPEEGYKRGTSYYYIWNDLHDAPAVWFTSQTTARSSHGDVGRTFAVKGTSTNAQVLVTAVHNNNRAVRMSLHTIIDGVYEEPNIDGGVYDSKYYMNFGLHTKANYYKEETQGAQFYLLASPLADASWIIEGELSEPSEFLVPAEAGADYAANQEIAAGTLGNKYQGTSIVTVGEKHLMVAPYADAEGKLAGVKVLNITAGLASAKVIATGKLDAAVEATAAATAVVAGEEELTVYLVADATVHTLEVALPGTVALSCTGMNKMYMAMRDMLQLEGTSADDKDVTVTLYDYKATVGDYQAFITFGDLELETESLKITRGSDEWTLAATIDADTAIYEFTATTAAPKTETIAPHAATWGGDAMNGYIIDCTTTIGTVQIGLMDGTAYGMGWMLNMAINDALVVESATIDAPTWEEDNLVLDVTVVSSTLDEYTIQLTATPKPAIEVIANATMALSEDEYEVGTMIVSATWNEHPLTVKLNGWPYYGYGEYAEANLVIEIDPENYDIVDAYSTAKLEKKEDVAVLTGTFSHWDGNKYALTLTIAEPAAAPVVDTVTVVCTDMVQGEEWGTPVLTGTCDLGDINISLYLEDTDHPESVYGEYGFAEYPTGLFPSLEAMIEGEESVILLQLMENTVAVYTDGDTQDSFVGTFLGSDWKVYVLDMKTPAPEDPSALDNVTTTVAPIKMIENGQLMIIKNGVQYNAQGAVVK